MSDGELTPQIPPSNVPQNEPAGGAPTPSRPTHYTIFRGPNGIRAGWRALIFLAIVVGLSAALFLIMGLIAHGRKTPPRMSMLTPAGLSLSEGTIFLFTSIAALIMARIEHRTYGQYGLPVRSAFKKDFWIGTVVGFAAISSCLAGIAGFRGFHITGMGIHGPLILSATAAWCITFVLVGLAEEFSFRGYLQYTLATGMGFWPAAVLLSVAFGLAHSGNPGETKFGLFSVVLFGLLFCLFLRRRGTLWWAVGFHAGWDWGQTYFYGVSDSGIPPYHNLFNSAFHGPAWLTGGSVGPEASVFTPIVLAVVAILFSLVYRRNLYEV
jgi:membrane protease YdiL (CAAX protease family)